MGRESDYLCQCERENWNCINLSGSPNNTNDDSINQNICEPDWDVIVTDQNHSIFVDAPFLDVNGDSLTEGSLLGVFYENDNVPSDEEIINDIDPSILLVAGLGVYLFLTR